MEVQVESAGGLARRLHVTVPAERLDREVGERLKNLSSRARVPGFRPGKAPLKVIQKQYGADARMDAVSELVRQTWPEALQQANIQPAGQPNFEVTSEAPGQPLAYVVSFDVYPDIVLGDLSTMTVTKPQVEVTDADVERLIENLRKARRELVTVERTAQAGDVVVVDFEGKLDGVAFPGGKGEKQGIEIGEGKFLPDMENALIGHAAGETFETTVNFPAEYRNETLAGKAAQFEMTVKEVKEPKLPELTDEFLKAHGVDEGGPAALTAKCRDALVTERDKAVMGRVKRDVMDQLLLMHPIEVPSGHVADEIQRLRGETATRMGVDKNSKIKPEQLNAMLPAEMFEPAAKRRVALGLLIAEVIKVRGIEFDKNRVDQLLEEMAADYEQPEDVRQLYRSRQDLMQGLHAVAIEEQVVESLIASAQTVELPMTLEDLLKSQNQAQAS
ncbi:MAG: trigger factor [Nevskia sp.]